MTEAGPTESLLRSSAVMAAGTVVSRVTGFARSAVLIYVLATSVLGDAFTVANTVPNILYILLAGGVLNSVIVPQVVRAMKREADGGVAYAQALMTLTMVVLGVFTVLATLAAPLIIDLYTTTIPEADLHAVVTMAYWCLPQIFFYGVFTVTGQILNARGRFGPMMWAPIVNNLVAIGFTLAFAAASAATIDLNHPASLTGAQIALLCGGATLGIAVQAVVLLPVLRSTGVPLRLRWELRGHGLGRVGSAGTVDGAVRGRQPAGLPRGDPGDLRRRPGGDARPGIGYGAGTASYANAYLVFVLPHSIITVSVVTALLPGLSGLAADGRLDVMAARLAATIRTVGVLLLPLSVILVVLGAGVMTLLFGYGRMTEADAAYAGLVLAAFGVGLVPFSSHYTVMRGFYALEDTRTPFLLQCVIAVATVVSAVVAGAFVPVGWRTAALAAGWSASYGLGYLLSAQVLARRIGGLQAQRHPGHLRPGRSGRRAGRGGRAGHRDAGRRRRWTRSVAGSSPSGR